MSVVKFSFIDAVFILLSMDIANINVFNISYIYYYTKIFLYQNYFTFYVLNDNIYII